MYVPYSMDESEPDLYGGLGGSGNNDDRYQEHEESYPNASLDYIECPKFFTQDDMNKVIQHNIKAVREAWLEGYDNGFKDGWVEGNENCQHR